MAHASCTDLETAEKLMGIPKVSTGVYAWSNKVTNAAYWAISFRPEDPSDDLGGYFSNMLIQLEQKRQIRVKEDKYTFTLFSDAGQCKLRAYQLEVVPPGKLSSNQDGVKIHGPHEHVGPGAAPLAHQFGTRDFTAWLGFFCTRINLELLHPIPDPFAYELTS